MPLYTILHRWSATPIALVEAADFPRALALAVERRVKLLYADLEGTAAPWAALGGADLRGADLSHAELACANLQGADLRTARGVGTYLRRALLGRADLRQADLRQADLRLAGLEEARLVGADLRGTLLYGARLGGAVLDWRWSVIPLELLRQDRGAGRQGSKLVADLAFEDERGHSPGSRWWCATGRRRTGPSRSCRGTSARETTPRNCSAGWRPMPSRRAARPSPRPCCGPAAAGRPRRRGCRAAARPRAPSAARLPSRRSLIA